MSRSGAGRPSTPRICMPCETFLGPNDPSVALTQFYATCNMGPQRTSKSRRLHFCGRCANSTAFGDGPSDAHPIEVEAWFALQELLLSNPTVIQAGIEPLRRYVMERRAQREERLRKLMQKLQSQNQLPPGEILPPEPRQLRAG